MAIAVGIEEAYLHQIKMQMDKNLGNLIATARGMGISVLMINTAYTRLMSYIHKREDEKLNDLALSQDVLISGVIEAVSKHQIEFVTPLSDDQRPDLFDHLYETLSDDTDDEISSASSEQVQARVLEWLNIEDDEGTWPLTKFRNSLLHKLTIQDDKHFTYALAIWGLGLTDEYRQEFENRSARVGGVLTQVGMSFGFPNKSAEGYMRSIDTALTKMELNLSGESKDTKKKRIVPVGQITNILDLNILEALSKEKGEKVTPTLIEEELDSEDYNWNLSDYIDDHESISWIRSRGFAVFVKAAKIEKWTRAKIRELFLLYNGSMNLIRQHLGMNTIEALNNLMKELNLDPEELRMTKPGYMLKPFDVEKSTILNELNSSNWETLNSLKEELLEIYNNVLRAPNMPEIYGKAIPLAEMIWGLNIHEEFLEELQARLNNAEIYGGSEKKVGESFGFLPGSARRFVLSIPQDIEAFEARYAQRLAAEQASKRKTEVEMRPADALDYRTNFGDFIFDNIVISFAIENKVDFENISVQSPQDLNGLLRNAFSRVKDSKNEALTVELLESVLNPVDDKIGEEKRLAAAIYRDADAVIALVLFGEDNTERQIGFFVADPTNLDISTFQPRSKEVIALGQIKERKSTSEARPVIKVSAISDADRRKLIELMRGIEESLSSAPDNIMEELNEDLKSLGIILPGIANFIENPHVTKIILSLLDVMDNENGLVKTFIEGIKTDNWEEDVSSYLMDKLEYDDYEDTFAPKGSSDKADYISASFNISGYWNNESGFTLEEKLYLSLRGLRGSKMGGSEDFMEFFKMLNDLSTAQRNALRIKIKYLREIDSKRHLQAIMLEYPNVTAFHLYHGTRNKHFSDKNTIALIDPSFFTVSREIAADYLNETEGELIKTEIPIEAIVQQELEEGVEQFIVKEGAYKRLRTRQPADSEARGEVSRRDMLRLLGGFSLKTGFSSSAVKAIEGLVSGEAQQIGIPVELSRALYSYLSLPGYAFEQAVQTYVSNPSKFVRPVYEKAVETIGMVRLVMAPVTSPEDLNVKFKSLMDDLNAKEKEVADLLQLDPSDFVLKWRESVNSLHEHSQLGISLSSSLAPKEIQRSLEKLEGEHQTAMGIIDMFSSLPNDQQKQLIGQLGNQYVSVLRKKSQQLRQSLSKAFEDALQNFNRLKEAHDEAVRKLEQGIGDESTTITYEQDMFAIDRWADDGGAFDSEARELQLNDVHWVNLVSSVESIVLFIDQLEADLNVTLSGEPIDGSDIEGQVMEVLSGLEMMMWTETKGDVQLARAKKNLNAFLTVAPFVETPNQARRLAAILRDKRVIETVSRITDWSQQYDDVHELYDRYKNYLGEYSTTEDDINDVIIPIGFVIDYLLESVHDLARQYPMTPNNLLDIEDVIREYEIADLPNNPSYDFARSLVRFFSAITAENIDKAEVNENYSAILSFETEAGKRRWVREIQPDLEKVLREKGLFEEGLQEDSVKNLERTVDQIMGLPSQLRKGERDLPVQKLRDELQRLERAVIEPSNFALAGHAVLDFVEALIVGGTDITEAQQALARFREVPIYGESNPYMSQVLLPSMEVVLEQFSESRLDTDVSRTAKTFGLGQSEARRAMPTQGIDALRMIAMDVARGSQKSIFMTERELEIFISKIRNTYTYTITNNLGTRPETEGFYSIIDGTGDITVPRKEWSEDEREETVIKYLVVNPSSEGKGVERFVIQQVKGMKLRRREKITMVIRESDDYLQEILSLEGFKLVRKKLNYFEDNDEAGYVMQFTRSDDAEQSEATLGDDEGIFRDTYQLESWNQGEMTVMPQHAPDYPGLPIHFKYRGSDLWRYNASSSSDEGLREERAYIRKALLRDLPLLKDLYETFLIERESINRLEISWIPGEWSGKELYRVDVYVGSRIAPVATAALRTVRRDLKLPPASTAQFDYLHEVAKVSALHNSNVGNHFSDIYGTFFQPENAARAVIISEWIEGESLRDKGARRADEIKLNVIEALNITLKGWQETGYIYRIEPEHILVDASGKIKFVHAGSDDFSQLPPEYGQHGRPQQISAVEVIEDFLHFYSSFEKEVPIDFEWNEIKGELLFTPEEVLREVMNSLGANEGRKILQDLTAYFESRTINISNRLSQPPNVGIGFEEGERERLELAQKSINDLLPVLEDLLSESRLEGAGELAALSPLLAASESWFWPAIIGAGVLGVMAIAYLVARRIRQTFQYFLVDQYDERMAMIKDLENRFQEEGAQKKTIRSVSSFKSQLISQYTNRFKKKKKTESLDAQLARGLKRKSVEEQIYDEFRFTMATLERRILTQMKATQKQVDAAWPKNLKKSRGGIFRDFVTAIQLRLSKKKKTVSEQPTKEEKKTSKPGVKELKKPEKPVQKTTSKPTGKPTPEVPTQPKVDLEEVKEELVNDYTSEQGVLFQEAEKLKENARLKRKLAVNSLMKTFRAAVRKKVDALAVETKLNGKQKQELQEVGRVLVADDLKKQLIKVKQDAETERKQSLQEERETAEKEAERQKARKDIQDRLTKLKLDLKAQLDQAKVPNDIYELSAAKKQLDPLLNDIEESSVFDEGEKNALIDDLETHITSLQDQMRGSSESRIVNPEAVTSLDRDITFVLNEEDINNLSETRYLELLGLKSLSESRLHLLILPSLNSKQMSGRVSELLGFKRVYYGEFHPALPKDAITIAFAEFEQGMGALGERIKELVEDNQFGLFTGSFGTALLYALSEGRLTGLQRRNGLFDDPDGIWSERAWNVLFQSYEIISAAA